MEVSRRAYKRDSSYQTDAKVSLDGKIWHDAVVFDISGGGLKFITNIMFDKGEHLWFDLAIPEFLSNREMKLQGTIRRIEHDQENHIIYGVSFKDVSEEFRINIDENIMMRERTYNKKKFFKKDI